MNSLGSYLKDPSERASTRTCNFDFVSTYDSNDLSGVESRHVALQPLPFGDPAASWIRESDDALKDGARAILYRVGAAAQLEEVFAVGAALDSELLFSLYEGADHAGAPVA